MKKQLLLKTALGIFMLMAVITGNAQQGNDPSDNYFKVYNERLSYFALEAEKADTTISSIQGYKEFREWANFFSTRYGADGSISEYYEAMQAAYDAGSDSISDLQLDWSYISPDSLWPDINGGSPGGVGQGLVISLWADRDDPDHIMAGTEHSGGLWETTDGGDNWENIAINERRIQGISSIFVDTDDHDEIYVTSCDQGISPGNYFYGLFYTYDGGQNWEQNKCWVETSETSGYYLYPGIHRKISPRAFLKHPCDSIMYLLTPKFLFQSTNSGASWKVLIDKNSDPYYNPYYGLHYFFNMEFDPGNPDTLYVCGAETYRVVTNGLATDTTNITSSIITNSNSTNYADAIYVDQDENFPNRIYFTVKNNNFVPEEDWQYCVVYDKTDDSFTRHLINGFTFHNFYGGSFMKCEVSPLNPDRIIVGGRECYAIDLSSHSFIYVGYGHGFHNDIRSTFFVDDGQGNDIAYIGADGGLTKVVNTGEPDQYWEYIANDGTNGIRNLDVQGFDCSQQYPDIMVMGNSHVGSSLRKNNKWCKIFLIGGDYASTLIDPENVNNIYITGYGSEVLRASKDMGMTQIYFHYYPNNYPPPVLGFKPNDTKTLYAGTLWKILEFDTDNLTDTVIEHQFAVPDGLGLEPDVQEFALSNDLPSTFFTGTDRYFPVWDTSWNNPATHISAFFRVNIQPNGQLSFTDLSQNLYKGLKGGPVTGLTLQVNDSDTVVWAGFGTPSTATGDEKNKVYYSKNLGQDWHPMMVGLPDGVPINEIQYYKNDDMLFLTNDLGVYLFNAVDSIWENIVNDMPPMTYNQIRFSPMRKLIRLSSHGHGIWEASLPCGYSSSPVTISSDTTWASDFEVHSDVVVENGASLTVSSVIGFAEEARVIVKRGGLLLIDGGTLTNACTDMWQGVEVWGDPKQVSAAPYQGMVLLRNGGTIENAVTGVMTARYVKDETKGNWIDTHFAGGIVRAINGNLRNNETGVHFYQYPANGYTYQSSSYFTNSHFIVDSSYFFEYDTVTMARLSQINNVKFNHCTFANNSYKVQYGTGIYSFSSKFSVEGQKSGNDWANGEFNNLRYGVYAIAGGTQYYADIRHSNFVSNLRGAYISGMSNAEVLSNNFEINTPYETDGGYGLYFDHATAYKVEENNFYHEGENAIGLGLVVNNSGGDPNRIYRNSFSGLYFGIAAQNKNGGGTQSGLVLKCNYYNETSYDKLILTESVSKGYGIATDQGSSSSNPEDMAGNLFYIPSPTPNDDYDDILNEGNHITYYYPLNNDNDRVKPVDYTHNTVEIKGLTMVPDPWSFENGCPPSEEPGGGGIGDTKGKMASAGQKADSTENILALLIDGGNTVAVQADVDNSVPPETMQVYNDLMAKSPYLSDTVISTAIEKEDVLPGAMIRDIMVANPKAAKSEKLMQKLDERWDPLPDYMKGQILAGRSIVSIREEAESRLAAHKLERAKHFNAIGGYYLNDTIDPAGSMDSLKALYENEKSLSAKYSLAFLSGELGDYGEGLAVLNGIPVQFDLSAGEAAAHLQFLAYYNLLSGLAQEGKSILGADSGQIAALFDMEASSSGMAGIYARNILLALNEMEYDEPILVPDILKSASAEDGYTELLNKANEAPGHITVRPNPAKDYIILAYDLEEEGGAIAEIHNMGAKIKYSANLKNKQDQITVDTRGWKAGVYIVSLKIDGKAIESLKFTVID